MSQSPLRTALALLAGGSLVLSVGCAYQNKKRDDDRQPVIHTGVGASIVWPNQSGPAFPPSRPPGAGAPPTGSAPAPGRGGSTTSSSSSRDGGGRGGVTMIGGNESDVRIHKEVHQEPAPLKWLLTPFAVAAYPFVKIYQAVAGDDEPPEASAETPPPTRHADLQAAHEQAQLEALEQELAHRGGGSGGAAPPSAAVSRPAPPRRLARKLSIAEELAGLQRGDSESAATFAAPRVATTPELTPRGVADRVEDRDRNGRPDHWEYREGGQLVRELYDENGDGTPDRSVVYDPVTGDRRRVDEDADFDGRTDSYAEYSAGKMVRRRSDADKDGVLDSWSFYRGGQLARLEQDRDGDGFRDRVGVYDSGQLVREEEDANGDGRPDRVTLYDAQERVVQRDEDRDGDGLVDMRSYYVDGRLARRELVDEGEAASIETRDLESSSWDAGEGEATTPDER